jgi:toxin FitB
MPNATPAAQESPRIYNIVDSSGWLEFFSGSERAENFAPAIEDTVSLVVPVISIYEVFKRVRQLRSLADAELAASLMQRALVVDIDVALTLSAASNGLPLADSLIYATAQQYGATLWTQDAHFESLPGVKYFSKS